MTVKKIIYRICLPLLMLVAASSVQAQLKLEKIPFDLNDILGKTKILKVKKGFNPIFSLGNYQINTNGILGEKLKGVNILGDVLNSKGLGNITKMYKTYKTGLVVFKALAAAGTGVAAYSTIRGLTADSKFNSSTVKGLLYPALGSIATGVITKILTKAAAYKAVDVFNGVVRNKIKDILSVGPASSTMGVGVYVKL